MLGNQILSFVFLCAVQAAVVLRGSQQPLVPNLVEEKFGPCRSLEGMTLSKILANYKGKEYRLTFLESTYTSVEWKCNNADEISDDDWAEEMTDLAQYDTLCTTPGSVVTADFQHGDYTWGVSTEAGYACQVNLVATGGSQVFDTTFYFTDVEDGAKFRAHSVDGGFDDTEARIFSYAPTYTFVDNCFRGGRVWNQMFADGYSNDGSCGSGRTGNECAQVCADDCAKIGNCIGYYYGDQQHLYGENALGQCVWYFDSVTACNDASESNPYNQHGLVYGTWAEMTDKFCGEADARTGPWDEADDECTAEELRVGDGWFYSRYKKTGRGYGNQ